MLCHSTVERLFGFTNVQFLALLSALYSINNVTFFNVLMFFGVLSFGCTSFCLSVLEGLNCTGMSCFRTILLNFHLKRCIYI